MSILDRVINLFRGQQPAPSQASAWVVRFEVPDGWGSIPNLSRSEAEGLLSQWRDPFPRNLRLTLCRRCPDGLTRRKEKCAHNDTPGERGWLMSKITFMEIQPMEEGQP